MSRSYRKNPVRWAGNCSSCKEEKRIYNRTMRHKDKTILKYYEEDSVFQIHKRDGLSWWDWSCDGKYDMWVYKKDILKDPELLKEYKKFIRK